MDIYVPVYETYSSLSHKLTDIYFSTAYSNQAAAIEELEKAGYEQILPKECNMWRINNNKMAFVRKISLKDKEENKYV